MKKKEIPKKNYVILLIIVVAVICFCFYLASWYRTITEYNRVNSVIAEVLPEIETNTFSSFLLDNPDTVVYIASASDTSIKSFEKQFKKIIIDNTLTTNIIYYNVDKNENADGIQVLVDNYMSSSLKKVKSIVVPNLIYFKAGEIVDLMYLKEEAINKKDVINFLERNDVIEDD